MSDFMPKEMNILGFPFGQPVATFIILLTGLLLTMSGRAESPPLPTERCGSNEDDADISDSREPALPTGFGGSSEKGTTPTQDAGPSLPSGLGGSDGTGFPSLRDAESDSTPALPGGLEPEAKSGQSRGEAKKTVRPWHKRLPFDSSGFAELRYGQRLQSDPHQEELTVPEVRWQLSVDGVWQGLGYRLTSDFLYNADADTHAIDLQRGTGWIDLREAWMIARPTSFLDLQVGRMVATWGTGDLLFLNDLFSKDWRSFLLGRDVEYLKAPTHGVRAQGYFNWINVDILVNPRFAPDRFIDGEQVSFFDPAAGSLVGQDRTLASDFPERGEVHVRLHRTFGGTEAALYFYDGQWKSPGGRDPAGRATFPELRAWGASLRGTFLGGIANAELSYYDSREDHNGTDPFVNNSQLRYLVGYERELLPNFTAAVQAYVEQKLDYSAYQRNLPLGFPEDDEYRTVLTLRLTHLLKLQTLKLSSFLFYSPTSQDWYWRPLASYKIDDHWTVSIGAGLFGGEDSFTFYNQFQDNSNAWTALRYGF